MKNLNLFRKSARGSEGSTLASAVVRPSFDRRSTVVKHLAFMLLFLLGSLNVWGEDVEIVSTFAKVKNESPTASFTASNTGSNNVYSTGTTFTITSKENNVWTLAPSTSGSIYFSMNNSEGGFHLGSKNYDAGDATLTSSTSFLNVTQIKISGKTGKSGSVTISVKVGNTSISLKQGSSETFSGSTVATATFISASPISGTVEVTMTDGANNIAYYIESITITTSSDSSDPTVTAAPESWDFGNVAKSAAASKEFTIAGSNLTGNLTFSVTGGYTLSANGATVSEGSVNTTLTVSKNINTTGTNNGTLTISGGGLDPSKTVGLTMTIVEDPEPTGTFELFSGDLEEGDYVICSGTTALKNALATNTNYIGYESVEVNNDEVENPSNDLVWHIAQSGEYWTIYNVTANNYAASTGAKNKGQVIADGTDDKAKWTVSGNSSYEFVNKANTAASVNSNLRYNSGYGFACYSTSTGSSLSLYKKQVAGQPKAPTFSVEGGNYESAQSVKLSCETEDATIYYTTNGDAPTSSSTQYNGTAIAVDHTMTIKAIAIKNEISSTVASATYTIIVWQTVADVWDNIVVGGPKNAHVYGYVSQTNVGGYANNFYISDNGSTEGNQLYAYRMDMNSFSVEVGDKVKLAGDLTNHQGTKEFEYANQGATQGRVIALEAKGAVTSVAVSGTATKTTYSANETFETAGLVVTATYANGFSEVVTEGITWDDDLTGHKVAATGTVHVTATVGGVISAAYGVAIEVSTKELSSIAVGKDSYTVYKGQALPKPVITATYSEGEPADVSAEAVYDTENVFDNTTVGTYNITVSYTFGGATKTTTYTVTVKDYANDAEHPYTVADAKQLIETIFADESTDDIYVHGIVSEIVEAYQAKFGNVTYNISDDGTTSGAQIKVFRCTASSADDIKEGDEVIVKGHAIYYQSSTPELLNTPTVVSLARTPNFEIENVIGFEVGSADLAVTDLAITQDGEGEVTLASSDKEEFVTIEGGKLHAVAPGTATITANLVADGIYKAATYEFSVTVIAAQVKYAITFDGNGADGGSAPEAIADKAAGAEVTLPANSYTKTGHTFDGWKVINNATSEEVEVVAGVFTMPASAVTIQAKWAEISVWATTYTSNVTLTAGTGAQAAKVRFTADGEQYDAVKAGTGKAGGSITVTVPAQATKLHLHVAGWTGENPTISITAPEGVTVTPASISATEDEGMNSNSPYTLQNNPVEQYLVLSLEGNTEEIQLTFSTDAGNKRFALYGVNQEGGSVPVLDRIEISGDLTTKSGYKAGDDLNMEGLTVNAIYTLNEVEQDPVDVTADVEWSYDALAENQTEVTVTATYGEKQAQKTITGLEVASADPKIYVNNLNVNFGTVAPNASVDAQTITVTLTNVAAATATLGGTNPEAFSITPASPAALTTSGDITISVVSTANVGTYSATITISDDAEAATSKVVNLSLTVEDVETAVSTTSKWVAATDADLVDGAEVLIVGVNNTDYYAMGVQNSNNRAAVAAFVDGEGVLTPGEGTMSFILVAQGDGTFALRTSNGKYLYAASSSKNYLRSQADVDNNAKWTLTTTSASAEASENNHVMQFNSSSSIFSCYASANQKPIALYVPQPAPTPVYETVRSGLEINRYYTVCLPKKVTAIKGASFWTLKSKSQDGATAYLEEETNNLPFAAGKPFIIQATAEKLEVVYEGAATEDAGINGALHGTLVYMDAAALAAAGSDVYMLFSNELRPVGEDNHLDKNRAYVKLSELNPVAEAPQSALGKRVRAMPMQPQVATGVDQVPSDQVPNTKVLINGQLYIMYNGAMYNVQGQLVK